MIRTILFEDKQDSRQLIGAILGNENDIQLVASFITVLNAANEVKKIRPHVILMDIGLPGGKSGLDVLSEILEKDPGVKILMITDSDDDDNIFNALAQGAKGYILKTEMDDLAQAIRTVYANKAYLSPTVTSHALKMIKKPTLPSNKLDKPLTDREILVLTKLAQGKKRDEISLELGLDRQPNAVGDCIKSIYAKLNINSKSQAVLKAIQMGLL